MSAFRFLLPMVLLAGMAAAQAPRPNIIMIVADDMGYGDAGCYGSSQVTTPNIDSMASQGLRFTDFHSNGSVCSPTRAALMTGMYPQRADVAGVITAASNRNDGLDTAFITLPEMLKKAGYSTAMFGKWHLGYRSRFNPVNQGFDEFRGFVSGNIDFFSHVDQEGYYDWWNGTDSTYAEEGYLTELVSRHGIDYVKRTAGKPFFLYLAHGAPHYPYQGPGDKAFRKVRPGSHPTNVPRQSTAKKIQIYKQMIEYMDKGIGELIDTLKMLGIEENTLVLFFSDNGPTGKVGSTGGLRGTKGSIFEGGHRVPAVAWWPGKIAAGHTTDETVAGFDLYPTLAALAGITVSGTDGIDVSSVFLEGDTLPERPLYWFSNGNYGMRLGKWKLNRVDKKFSLFDLEADLKESSNLAASQSAVRNDMVATFNEWEKTAVKTVPELTWSVNSSSRPRGTTKPGSLTIGADAEVSVEIYSLNGTRRMALSKKGGVLTSNDLSGLPSGVYLATFSSGDRAPFMTRTMLHRQGR